VVIGLRVPGLDPVHKVTIVPRGRALGITASLPEEDRHSYTKDWLEGQLTMLFGGRVAEEMVFGPEKITTGAGNDIERATQMARRMVTRFGMSDVIGLMAVGDSDQEVFLGRELVQRREYSEHTAQQVDQEVKRILDEAYDRAREVLETNRTLLESLSKALLERETLDRDEVEALKRGETLPPMESLADEEEALVGKPQGRGRIGGGGGEPGGSRGPGRSIEGGGAIDSGERSSQTQGEEAHPPRVESPTRVARSES
jgi:cell division protease FtsH